VLEGLDHKTAAVQQVLGHQEDTLACEKQHWVAWILDAFAKIVPRIKRFKTFQANLKPYTMIDQRTCKTWKVEKF